ncbi:sulfotransferase family protein [Psychromarinibacter sp. S121]|uniref:sulfotransferase family protein n=1 Tax=Psychromarinibacter sp. S121 TaxID=3415127 RepID=UPI003C7D2FA4
MLPQLGLAYCRVPKAANSSVRFLLAKRFSITPPEAEPNLVPNKDRFWAAQPPGTAQCLTPVEFALLQAGPDRPWCFSFVRNPVARLYSAWNNKIVENRPLSPRFKKMGVTPGMDFASFVDRVAETVDADSNIHVRSQTSILTLDGQVLPDFVGRVETIVPDWNHIRYEMRVRTGRRVPPLWPKNVRAKAQPDIADRLPRSVLEKIIRRYHDDFARFYPYELRRLA